MTFKSYIHDKRKSTFSVKEIDHSCEPYDKDSLL